jgi:hypothetical protein
VFPVNLWRLLLPVRLVFLPAGLRVHWASGIPHALFRESGTFKIKPRAKTCGEIADSYLAVIASAAKQSIVPRKERMDCFAALAMTMLGCLKLSLNSISQRSQLSSPAKAGDPVFQRR